MSFRFALTLPKLLHVLYHPQNKKYHHIQEERTTLILDTFPLYFPPLLSL
jgi:hypothetical protein